MESESNKTAILTVSNGVMPTKTQLMFGVKTGVQSWSTSRSTIPVIHNEIALESNGIATMSPRLVVDGSIHSQRKSSTATVTIFKKSSETTRGRKSLIDTVKKGVQHEKKRSTGIEGKGKKEKKLSEKARKKLRDASFCTTSDDSDSDN